MKIVLLVAMVCGMIGITKDIKRGRHEVSLFTLFVAFLNSFFFALAIGLLVYVLFFKGN